MELSKESVESCAKTHAAMLEKAETIWSELLKLGVDNCEYFTSIDDLRFDDDDGNAYVSGWDGSGACGATIPLQYFYDEEWLEQAKKKAEEIAEQKRLVDEFTQQQKEILRESRDREEYERLKKKFE